MFNPLAHTPGMLAMGRRDPSEPVVHHPSVLCQPCANRECGWNECWHGDCACKQCNPKGLVSGSIKAPARDSGDREDVPVGPDIRIERITVRPCEIKNLEPLNDWETGQDKELERAEQNELEMRAGT